MKLIILFVMAALLTVGVGRAGAAAEEERGVHPATQPIVAHIHKQFPDANTIFVNCPEGNSIEYKTFFCELRFLRRGGTVDGAATVTRGGHWSVTSFRVGPAYPHRWIGCGVRGMSRRHDGHIARRLKAYGLSCGDAHYLAAHVRGVARRLVALPRDFRVAQYGTFTEGFVTNTFWCVGKHAIRQGSVNPYGHETARCSNQFGDRFTYVFDQHS